MQIFLVRNKLNINYNGLAFSEENENPQPIKGKKKRVVKEHSLILKQKKNSDDYLHQ